MRRDSDRAGRVTARDGGTEHRTGPDGYKHAYDSRSGRDLGVSSRDQTRYRADQ